MSPGVCHLELDTLVLLPISRVLSVLTDRANDLEPDLVSGVEVFADSGAMFSSECALDTSRGGYGTSVVVDESPGEVSGGCVYWRLGCGVAASYMMRQHVHFVTVQSHY